MNIGDKENVCVYEDGILVDTIEAVCVLDTSLDLSLVRHAEEQFAEACRLGFVNEEGRITVRDDPESKDRAILVRAGGNSGLYRDTSGRNGIVGFGHGVLQ